MNCLHDCCTKTFKYAKEGSLTQERLFTDIYHQNIVYTIVMFIF